MTVLLLIDNGGEYSDWGVEWALVVDVDSSICAIVTEWINAFLKAEMSKAIEPKPPMSFGDGWHKYYEWNQRAEPIWKEIIKGLPEKMPWPGELIPYSEIEIITGAVDL